MNEDQVRKIVQAMLDSNYDRGNPRIAPHRHNEIDNLRINAKDIVGLPPGTAPGGNVNDVQVNDGAGNFYGDDNFIYDFTNDILQLSGEFDLFGDMHISGNIIQPDGSLDISTVQDNAGVTIETSTGQTGVSGNILIKTDDPLLSSGTNRSGSITLQTGVSNSTNAATAKIAIHAGNAKPSTTHNGGSVEIFSGTGGSTGGSPGTITMLSGNGGGGGSGGDIDILGGNSTGTDVDGGVITIRPGLPTGSGVGGLVSISRGNLVVGVSNAAGADGVIALGNVTTAPGTPGNGGIFYASAGALHWIGSGGTDTVIAPA